MARNPVDDGFNMVVLYGAPSPRPWIEKQPASPFVPESPLDNGVPVHNAAAKQKLVELTKYIRALRVAKTTKQELTVGLDEICNQLTEILAQL